MNQPKSIALGENELDLIEKYAKKYGLSRSAVVRYIINSFFSKNKEAN